MANSVSHVLHEFVNYQVVMSDDDRKRNVKIVEEIKVRLIDKMKEEDALFNAIYGGIYETGSYYDKLKVGDADEFDLNVMLNLPFLLNQQSLSPPSPPRGRTNRGSRGTANRNGKTNEPKSYIGYYKIVRDNQKSGYAQYKLNRPVNHMLNKLDPDSDYRDLSDLFDDKGMLLSTKNLKCWWQSVVDRGLTALHADPFWRSGWRRRRLYQINRSFHGPAATLTLVKRNKDEINVDLVPVIPLKNSVSDSIQANRMFDFIPNTKKRGFLVPKPPSRSNMFDYESDDRNATFFRVSIPQAERLLMTNKGIAKTLIRIFKALRDSEKWLFVVSYHIKTLFLWKLAETPATWYWNAARLEDLFIMMLEKFRKAMDQKWIPNIFFPSHNLLEDINDDDASKVRDRLDEIIDIVIDDRLDELKEIFPGESD